MQDVENVENLPPFATSGSAATNSVGIPCGFHNWTALRNDNLASAAATPVISSSDSVLINTCSTFSSSELESAVTGATVEGAGSEKTIFFLMLKLELELELLSK